MLALIDIQGQSNFDCLNKDIEAQLKYVYEAIDCDDDYNDMFEFMKKYFQETNDMSSPAKVKEKAETSRLIRDRGNKVLFEKEILKTNANPFETDIQPFNLHPDF